MRNRPAGFRWLLGLTILAGAHSSSTSAQDGPTGPEVNKAIDRGVDYLKAIQRRDGSWTHRDEQNVIGMTALGGLALFESGVPRDHPSLVKAEEYVRDRILNDYQTYDVALAIMFLSKLHPDDVGETRDLIRKLGWRLAASERGGMWDYGLRNPGPNFPLKIVERPPVGLPEANPPGLPAAEGPGGVAAGPGGGGNAPGAVPGKADQGIDGKSKAGGTVPGRAERRIEGESKGGETAPAQAERAGNGEPKAKSDGKAAEAPNAPRGKPAGPPNQVKDATNKAGPRQRGVPLDSPVGDHSNTQFAMIGVWIAGRYGYDNQRTLERLEAHFRATQRGDGSWGYHARDGVGSGSQAMTCVGVLGMYLAATRDRDDGLDREGRGKELESDPTFRRGLEAVTDYAKRMDANSNSYFLWSIERVCVSLGKETLDGFDWYKAGARILLDRQRLDGSWDSGFWGPNADTCLTLLFLHRSNLVEKINEIVQVPGFKMIAGLPYRAAPPGEAAPMPPAEEEIALTEPPPAAVEPAEVATPAETESSVVEPGPMPPAEPEVRVSPEPTGPKSPGRDGYPFRDPRESGGHLGMLLVLVVLLAVPSLWTRRSP